MKKSGLTLLGLGMVVASLSLWGCPNPNDIGVQTYGTVQVTCVQASNQQPVSGALARVDGSGVGNTNASGVAIIKSVPIGSNEPVNCDAPGLSGTNTVNVQATNSDASPALVTVSMSPS